jgi:hypothetical protein
MSNFKNKYLKYKNKYIELKKQYGGEEEEYFIDTETQRAQKEIFTLSDFEKTSHKIDDLMFSDQPIFHNETVSINSYYDMAPNIEGFIIKIKKKVLIIQVGKDTITSSKVLHVSKQSMNMDLISSYGLVDIDGNEVNEDKNIEIDIIRILLSDCLLILIYSNEDDFLKIFIEEFDYRHCFNRRYEDLSLKSISDPSSSDEYNKPKAEVNCGLIEFIEVETEFFEKSLNNYINLFRVYQIINSILVINEYQINFIHLYQNPEIYKSQINFFLPKFKGLVFSNIDNVREIEDDNTITLFITYKDVASEEFIMTLKIIKNYSKSLAYEPYDGWYYIFKSPGDKIQIYGTNYIKRNIERIQSFKKLIGIINFDNDEHPDNLFENMFVKSSKIPL